MRTAGADRTPIALVYAETLVGELLLALLRDEGYAPVAFVVTDIPQLHQVVDWLTDHAPACCLCELAYPFSTGWAHLGVLQALAPASRFVVLSDDPQPPAASRAGMRVLAKPFDVDEVLAAVADATAQDTLTG